MSNTTLDMLMLSFCIMSGLFTIVLLTELFPRTKEVITRIFTSDD